MDSSTLTRRRQTRALFVDRIYAREELNRGVRFFNRRMLGGGVMTTEFKDNVLDKDTGAVNVTPAELDTYIQNEFGPSPDPPLNADFTYWILYERSDTPYFYYAIYIKETGTWVHTQSSVSTEDYTYDFNINYLKCNFIVGFTNESQVIMDVLNTNGTIKRTLTVPYSSINYNNVSIQNYIEYHYIDSGILHMYRYNFAKDTIELIELNISENGSINHIFTLMEGIILIIYNGDTSLYTIYVWPNGISSLTTVATCNDYDPVPSNYNTYEIYKCMLINQGSYYGSFKLINQDGNILNYTLPAETYNSSFFYTYGDNHRYVAMKMYNTKTEYYDFFIFNKLPNITPIILTGLRQISQVRSYGSNFYDNKTYVSNHIVISDLDNTYPIGYETGTVYIIFENAISVITQTYTSNNKVYTYYDNIHYLNNRGVLLIEKDNTYVKSHIYTVDGDTITNLFPASQAFDGFILGNMSFFNPYNDYFSPILRIYFESNVKDVFFIIKYDNTVVASSLEAPQNLYFTPRASGKNIAFIYPGGTIAYCIDGIYTKTEEIFDTIQATQPDNASGVIFALYDSIPYRVKVISPTGAYNANISLTNYIDYFVNNDFFCMVDYYTDGTKISFIDKEGNEYYYEDPLQRINIDSTNRFNTDSSSIFEIYNNDDQTYFYVVFEYGSKTYFTLEQPPNMTNKNLLTFNNYY
jgi:hypothetical protein